MALYCKYSHNFQVLDNKAKKHLKKSNSAYNIIETTPHSTLTQRYPFMVNLSSFLKKSTIHCLVRHNEWLNKKSV